MPSQYSTANRLSYEDVLRREIEREDAEAEICAYLAESDAMRIRLARARIITESRSNG